MLQEFLIRHENHIVHWMVMAHEDAGIVFCVSKSNREPLVGEFVRAIFHGHQSCFGTPLRIAPECRNG